MPPVPTNAPKTIEEVDNVLLKHNKFEFQYPVVEMRTITVNAPDLRIAMKRAERLITNSRRQKRVGQFELAGLRVTDIKDDLNRWYAHWVKDAIAPDRIDYHFPIRLKCPDEIINPKQIDEE